MAMTFKFYRVDDFVVLQEDGEINFQNSLSILSQMITDIAFSPDHHLIVDVRDSSPIKSPEEFFQVVKIFHDYLDQYKDDLTNFKHKIAFLMPEDPERIKRFKTIEAQFTAHNIDCRSFHDFESTLDWFSTR